MAEPDKLGSPHPIISDHRAKHMSLRKQHIATDGAAVVAVTIDDAESPLSWLAKRRGRNGRPLIDAHQYQAGERLRADFTRAHMMPRTTSNWESPIARGRHTPGNTGNFSDIVIAARQRVQSAVEAVGPEFSGLLLDICCFLKSLDDIERERAWPARSAKVVLRLALERLARHYGLASQATGGSHRAIRAWTAPGEDPPQENV